MRIIIDCDYGPDGFPVAFHSVDIADQSARDTLAAIQADKTALGKSGWAEVSKLPGLPDGTRRWDVIVAAQAKKNAPQELTVLNLTA